MDNDKLEGEFILNSNKNTDTNVATKSRVILNSNPTHFYSSYCENPKGFKFSQQETNERVLLILRKHFITNLPWILSAIALGLLPLLFPLIIASFPIPLPGQSILLYYIASYYLIIFGFILINFSLWYFHTGLVTSKRLLDIDLAGILYRQISEAKNSNIEEVTYAQVGFIASLFNYGNVYIQTSGAEVNIEYDKVPRPSKVADIISDLTTE